MPYYHKLTIDERILKDYFDELTKVQIKRKNKFYRLKPNMLSQFNVNINNAYRAIFMRCGNKDERYFTIIDRALVRKISNHKWRLDSNKTFDDKYYVVTGNKSTYQKLHHLALGLKTGNVNPDNVHHIENTFDNRKSKSVCKIKLITNTAHGSIKGSRLPLLPVNKVNQLQTLLNFI